MVLDLRDLGVLAIRVLAAFCVSLFLSPQFAFANSQAEHWEHTGLNKESYQKFINTLACYKEEDRFLGCIAAINSLLSTSSQTLSNNEIRTLPEMGARKAIIGPAEIREYFVTSTSHLSTKAAWEYTSAQQAVITQSWKNTFKTTKANQISFEVLVDKAFESADKTILKLHLANSLNAYIKVAVDPHSRIISSFQKQASAQSTEFDIENHNVTAKLLDNPLMANRKIGYIHIKTFNDASTCKNFVNKATALRKQNAETLVLDLRDNTGGLLAESVCIAEQYLDSGHLVLTQRSHKTNELIKKHIAQKDAQLFKLYNNKPLVILQNAMSASSSEALAGALHTYGRALIVGERSYGKGTVQDPLKSLEKFIAGVTYYKTTSKFYFADGSSNQLHGITPDFEAYRAETASFDDQFAVREAELYPNAIAASKPLKPYSTQAITSIQNCLNIRSNAALNYALDLKIDTADHQIFTAREVASCLMGR